MNYREMVCVVKRECGMPMQAALFKPVYLNQNKTMCHSLQDTNMHMCMHVLVCLRVQVEVGSSERE